MNKVWQQPLPSIYRQLSDAELRLRIGAARETLGSKLAILGHHYQQDAIIDFADFTGDSFELSRRAAEQTGIEYVVFCGVHFMAESADILTDEKVRVILPDLGAGCSMADMANLDQTLDCWEQLKETCPDQTIVPITYMNSSAAIKAFVGEHGGAVCTSSNARAVLEWAFARGDKVLFFPDQHLGRNTGRAMGYGEDDMRIWNPSRELGGLEERDVKDATFLLWRGWCSVHQRFTPDHVAAFRAEHPDGTVIVHPECSHEVVEVADQVGSTERILDWVEAAPAGSVIGVGTEIHMVQRLAHDHPDKTVVSLDPLVCPCSTMFRIDAPHLAWCLEALVRGEMVNQIKVDERTAEG